MARVAPLAKGLVALSVAVLGAVALAGGAAPATPRTFTISVDAREYAFSLSRRSIPAGSTVRFVVRNRGNAVHDFVVATRKRTRILRPRQRQTITVSFPRKGTFRFLCSVPGHARLGMKGAIGVSVKPPPTPPPAPPVDTSDLVSLERIGTFERPVLLTAPPGDTRRIFVVEQGGTVRIVREGTVVPSPFLDIRELVTATGESGLLSIAFAPDYASTGLLYAFYNAREGPYGNIRIAEFRTDASDADRVDPSSERPVLTIPKPYENHNGGMLQFGSDGYLYASVGDGDPGVLNRAGAFAQRLDELLGNIIRIDPRRDPYSVPADNPFVAVPGARPEVWAYGLRNPWRFWIDPESNVLYVPDVGSTSREEINVVARGGRAANFGWPCFEGTVVFDDTASCERPVAPLLDYPRANAICAVIGGVVVRDPRLAALSGRYLYGDLCSGVITAIAVNDGRIAASGELGLVVPELSSFGVDGLGRVYVMSLRGDVYRLDPRAP